MLSSIITCAIVLLTYSHTIFADLSAAAFSALARSSLGNSTWPLDHADTARSKFSMQHSGLPADLISSELLTKYNSNIKNVQWMYTAGPHSEWLYLIHGFGSDGQFVSKLESSTLNIIQQIPLPPSAYIGGLLIHRNEHVYCIHANVLYRYWLGDLFNVSKISLPHSLNHQLVATNGMLVTQDGLLVIKQFSLNIWHIYFMLEGKRDLFNRIYYTLMAVAVLIAFIPTKKQTLSRLIASVGRSVVVGHVVFYAFPLLVLYLICGTYNPIRFLADGLLSSNHGGGELKLLHPITLEVVAAAQLPERCSYGRMAMQAVTSPDGQHEDAIILLGDENIYQFRWRPASQELFWVRPAACCCCCCALSVHTSA
jgi:hypothetical protein